MPKAAADKLVEFLRTEAGEYLRGAVHYNASEYETLYLRDDVGALYSEEKMQELFEYYRQIRADQRREEPFDLGHKHCSADFYDGAILFHFTQGDDVGTVITLEPEAGRDIIHFISDCLAQLYKNSPQDITSVPDWLQQ